MSNDSIAGAALVLFVLFIVLICILSVAAAVATYFLSALGLKNIGEKVNYPNKWMCWVPGPNYWMMAMLPGPKDYTLFIFNKTFKDRKAAFWAWVILCGVGFIIGFLSWIPFLGWVIFALGMLALIFGSLVAIYPMLKDLYEMFIDEKKANLYAILGTVIPILHPIFLFIVSKEDPIMYPEYNKPQA